MPLDSSRLLLDDDTDQYEPVPFLYIAFCLIWIGFLIYWILSWKRRRPNQTTLQKAMTCVPVLKIPLAISGAIYFQIGYSRAETALISGCFWVFFLVSYECVLFMTLLLVSKGWCITRASLQVEEHRHIKIVILLLAFSLLAYHLLNQLFAFGLVVVYFIILGSIFSNLSINIRNLRSQLLLLRQHGLDPVDTVTHLRFRIFRVLQSLLSAYVFAAMLLQVVVSILLSAAWLHLLLREAIDFLMYIFLCMMFRHNVQNEILMTIPNLPQLFHTLASAQLMDSGTPTRPDGVHNAWPEPTQPTGPPVLVVENPPSVDATGKLIANVAMAIPIFDGREHTLHPPLLRSDPGSDSDSDPVVPGRAPGVPDPEEDPDGAVLVPEIGARAYAQPHVPTTTASVFPFPHDHGIAGGLSSGLSAGLPARDDDVPVTLLRLDGADWLDQDDTLTPRDVTDAEQIPRHRRPDNDPLTSASEPKGARDVTPTPPFRQPSRSSLHDGGVASHPRDDRADATDQAEPSWDALPSAVVDPRDRDVTSTPRSSADLRPGTSFRSQPSSRPHSPAHSRRRSLRSGSNSASSSSHHLRDASSALASSSSRALVTKPPGDTDASPFAEPIRSAHHSLSPPRRQPSHPLSSPSSSRPSSVFSESPAALVAAHPPGPGLAWANQLLADPT